MKCANVMQYHHHHHHHQVTISERSILSVSLRAVLSGDRIAVWARFSTAVPTGSEAHPASYTMGTGSFPWLKWPGRGVDHPHPSSAEVKERVEFYLFSPSGPSWRATGRALPLAVIWYSLICCNTDVFTVARLGSRHSSHFLIPLLVHCISAKIVTVYRQITRKFKTST